MKTHAQEVEDRIKQLDNKIYEQNFLGQFGPQNNQMAETYYKSLLDIIAQEKELSEGNIGIVSYKHPERDSYMTEASNTWTMPNGKRIPNPGNKLFQDIIGVKQGKLGDIEPMLHGERLADMRARDRVIQAIRGQVGKGYNPKQGHSNTNLRKSSSLAKMDYDRIRNEQKIQHDNSEYEKEAEFLKTQKNKHIKYKKNLFNMPAYEELPDEEKELYRVKAYNNKDYLPTFKGNEYFAHRRIFSERPFCQDQERVNCRDFFNTPPSNKTYLDPKENNSEIKFGHLVNHKEGNLDDNLRNYRSTVVNLLKPPVTKAKGGKVNTNKLQKLLLELREMMV